jgi:hypothetical protein
VNEIEQAAQLSIGRACGFAGFGIALAVVALSFEPLLAAKTGAVLSLGLTLSLLVLSRTEPTTRPIRRPRYGCS